MPRMASGPRGSSAALARFGMVLQTEKDRR
jgi:hypothetical protein